MSDVLLSFIIPRKRVFEVPPLLKPEGEEDFWRRTRKREVRFAYMTTTVEVQILCDTNVRETQNVLEEYFCVRVSADTPDRVFAPRVIRKRETQYWEMRGEDIPEVKDIYVWFVYDWTKIGANQYTLYRLPREWIEYDGLDISGDRIEFIEEYIREGGVDDEFIDFVSIYDAPDFEGYYDTICSARKDGGNYAGDSYDQMIERYIESLVCNGKPTYVDLHVLSAFSASSSKIRFIDEKRRTEIC